MILLVFSQSTYACRTDRIVMMRRTTIGLNFGSGSFSFTGGLQRQIQIPLRVGATQGCMTQKSALDFEVKRDSNGVFEGEFNIYPPQVEFKKIKGRVETYLKINEESSERKELNFSLVSFTCSDESIIAVEGFEGSLNNAAKVHDLSLSIQQIFATGAAAESLSNRRDSNMKVYGKTQHLPQSLEEIFHKRLSKDQRLSLEDIERNIVSKPSVLLSTRLATGAVDLDTSFTTLTSTQFGCSHKFKSMMIDYHQSNLKKQLKTLDLKVKVSKKKIRIKW